MELNEKECMRMVIQAIETDSIDRVEDIVGRLVDLFNSRESQKYLEESLENKKLSARRAFSDLEREIEKSLYEGMQAMRQLVTDAQRQLWSGISAVSALQLNAQSLHFLLTQAADVLKNDALSDEEKIKEIWNITTQPSAQREGRGNYEEFLSSWYAANATNPRRDELYTQIRRDLMEGLDRQNSVLEDIFDDIRANFKGLKIKLMNVQRDIKTARTAGRAAASSGVARVVGLTSLTAGLFSLVTGVSIAAAARTDVMTDFVITKRGGDRFLSRTDPDWYTRIEMSLFDYIRGDMTEETLIQLIKCERLEEDLPAIREHILTWVSSCKLLTEIKIPKLNKEAYILEGKRTWAFAKALLLDDRKHTDHHSELLEKLVNVALSSGDDVDPIISIARLPDGRQTVKLKLIARPNADMQSVDARVRELARLAGGGRVNRTSDYEYKIDFNNIDGITRFSSTLAKHVGKLAEVRVRAALLGDYDVNTGSRLTNPAFNRIYGKSLSAPGFRSTADFGYLDYSGEKYHCPNGWRRISINVAESAQEFDEKYGGWHVAYHGTNHILAPTILSGFVPTLGLYSDGEQVVYFSPSIEYANHRIYAKVYEVDDKSGTKQYVQMVFQLRINPKNIWKKGGTILGALAPEHQKYSKDRDDPPADPNFPENRNLEWLVKPIPGTTGWDMFKNMFVIYGIMIRISDTHPKNNPVNAWWQKK